MTEKLTIAAVGLCVALAWACADRPEERSTQPPQPEPSSNAAAYDADNTARNVRDRSARTATPMDQGNSEADLTMTQKIRQAVIEDGSLSIAAKNVKIITVAGIVTLRGPVKSEAEVSKIVSIAERLAGGAHVVNELEVEKG